MIDSNINAKTPHAAMDIVSVAIDHSLAFRSAAPRDVYAHWRGLCANRSMPRRCDIDPVSVYRHLPCMALLDTEATDQGGIRLFPRLSGNEIEYRFGLLHRKPLEQTLPSKSLGLWHAMARAVITVQQPLRLTGIVKNSAKMNISYEILLAPLSDNNDALAGLVAAAAFNLN